jgi:peptide/nickel transport system substrate-binding protein
VVVAIYRDGKFDELDAASYNGPHFIFKMIYEGFVEDGGKGEIIPVLATSWDISEDGRTYVYHLREGVKFTDGTDFNAEAVVFNLKRWINDGYFDGLSSVNVESVEAVDPLTVKVVYADGAYPILVEQSYPRPVRFLSPASIKPDPSNPRGIFEKPVGTGPWMLETYVKDQEFTLVPNPGYWGPKPKIDRLRFKVVTDSQARILALRSGEVAIVGGDLMGKIPLGLVPEIMGEPTLEVKLKGTLCAHFIAFNNTTGKFDDKNLRMAINHALDKKAVAEGLFDNIGLVANGFFQRDTPYTTESNNYAYPGDKELAKKLLDDGGYLDTDGDGVREKDGQKLEYKLVLTVDEFPEWKPLAEYVQAELASVGIKINLTILDRNSYTDMTYYMTGQSPRDYDLALKRTSSDSQVPHGELLTGFLPWPNPEDPARIWTDPHLSEMVKQTLNTLDSAERQKRFDELLGFISSEAITVPIYHPVTAFAIDPTKIKDFEIGVNNYAPVEWSKLDVADK